MVHRILTRLLVAALALASAVAADAADSPFHVVRRIPIGGEGGWDLMAMDMPGHRLFLSHATHVVVLDVRADSVVGDIPNTPGVHGVALAPELGRGYTSNGRDSSVTVFDLKTLAVLGRVSIPARNPDAITYDPVSGRVFTFNGGSANATVIDARTQAVVGSVVLGGRPELAVVDSAGRLYVNLEDSSAVVAVDTRSLAVLARWPLAPGEGPTGLALDRAHQRLFSACGNQKLVVLDATSGRVVTTLPIGRGVDGAAFDATRGLVFTSNGEGTLSVIQEDDPEHFHAAETDSTGPGARTLALDPATGTVYVASADFGTPPAPTVDRPHPRPPIMPGSFRILAVQRR